MTSGMAHVSGAVMAAYVKIARRGDQASADRRDHDRARHHHAGQDLHARKSEKPATAGKVEIKVEKTAVNVIDAAAQGAGDGLHLALNIGGMLIAFLALIAMVTGFSAGCTRCRAWAGCRHRWNDFRHRSSRRWRG